MNSKQKIATALTALSLALGSNSTIAASAKVEPSKGPASINLDALKNKECKAECDTSPLKAVPKAEAPKAKTQKAKTLGKTATKSKLASSNICDNIVYDSYRFGPLVDNAGKTVSKFSSAVKIAENIPEECKSKFPVGASFASYKDRVEVEGMIPSYGLDWKNYRYTIGPKNKPIFSNMDSDAVVALLNGRYLDGKLNNVQVYQLGGKGVVKDSKKSAPNEKSAPNVMSDRKVTLFEDRTLDPARTPSAPARESYVSKDTYTFDIDGNGKPNELNLVEKNGKIFVSDKETGTLLSEKPLDNVRYEVLSNIRNVEGGQTDAMKGYLMTAKKQGEEVIRFIVDTNKDANKTLTNNMYIPTQQTKFANLEGLVTFMDKVANLSERADQIDTKALKYISDGKIQIDTKQIDMKAYSSTFGEEVPTGLVVLYFTAGSAIYTVLNSDYLPTVKGSDVMAQVRGSRDAVNLDMLLTAHKHNGDLSKTAVNAYTQTKSMYNAQFKASEKKVSEVKF